MSGTIASLVATLGLDASNFESGIASAEKSAGGLTSSLGKIGMVTFGATAAGVLGLGTAAVSIASDYDAATRGIQANLGVTADKADELGGVVKSVFGNNFGADMADGAAVLTTAFQTMGDVGTTELEGITTNALRLRDTFGTDTTETINAVDSLMQNFGLTSTEAFDMLTVAQQKGLNGSGDLLETIGEYGPQFRAAGAGPEEFFSILESGYQAGVLGTDKIADSFKEFNIRVLDGSKTTSDALKGLGIDQEALNAGMKDGSITGTEAYGMVTKALAGIEDPLLKNQLGVALLGTQYEDLGSSVMDGVSISNDALGEFSGATAALDEQYNGLSERLAWAWRQIQLAILPVGDAIRNGLIVAFDLLVPKIQQFGGYLTGLYAQSEPVRAAIAELAASLADKLMPPLQEFAAWFTGNSDAMAAAGAAIGGILVVAFTGLAIAAGSAAVAMVAAALPFVAIIAVAAALGAGIFLLIKHWDEVTAKFPIAATALDAVKDGWASVLSWITGTFMPGVMGIADAIMDAGTAALGFARGHWTEIQTVIDGVLMFIITQVQNVFGLIGGIIEGALMVVSGIIKTVTGLLSGDWEQAWEGIKEIANGVWTAIVAVVTFQINTIKNIITNLGPALVAIMSMAWDLVKNVTQAAWDGIKAAVSAAADAIPPALSAAWDAIKSAASAAWDAIKSAVSTAIQAIPGILSSAGGAMVSALGTAWEALKSAASAAWDGIKSFVSAGVAALPGLISAGAGLLMAAGQTAFEGLKSGVEAVWNAIAAWVPTLPGIAADLIRGGVGLLLAAGEALLNAMWDGAKAIFTNLIGWADTLGDLIRAAVVAGVAFLLQAGQELMEKLWAGIKEVWAREVHFFSNLPSTILGLVGDLGGVLKDAGAKVIQGLIDGIQSKMADLQGMLGSVTDKIPDWKGPAEKDETLLYEAGQLIIGGLVAGIDSATPEVESSLEDLTAQIEEWAVRFAESPRYAAEAFSKLDDDIRYSLGAALMEMEGFGAATQHVAEDFSIYLQDIPVSLDTLKASVADMAATGDASFETVEAALLGAGYTATEVGQKIGYVMDSLGHSFQMGTHYGWDLEESVTNAMYSIDEVMMANRMSVEQWAWLFGAASQQAATEFNKLPDSMRYALGPAIEALGGFGDAAGQVAEDFSFYLNEIPPMFDPLDAAIEGSKLSIREWAQYFTDYPRNAAESFNKLEDDVRSQIGAIIEEMDGFGAAAQFMAEDFSFYVKDMGKALIGHHQDWGFFVDATAEEMTYWADNVSDMKDLSIGYVGAMMQDMAFLMQSGIEYGRKISTQDIDNWMADLETSIHYAGLPAAAGAEIEAIVEEMRAALEGSGMVVTDEVLDLMEQIGAIFGMTDAQMAALQAGVGVADALRTGLDAVPPTLEEIRANIQANFAQWGGTFATEMRTGGRMVGAELEGMLDSLTASIESANLSGQAESEAFAMLDKMIKTIESNEGTVTTGVDKMLRRIRDLILDPANVAAADTTATDIVDSMVTCFKDAIPLVEGATTAIGVAAIDGFENSGMAEEIKQKARDAMLDAERAILDAQPLVQAATTATGAAAIAGWESMDFGTWLVSTINANMASATTAITTGGNAISVGLASGVNSGAPEATAAVDALAKACIWTVQGALQTHSPSKVFYAIGVGVAAGLANGISASAPLVQNSVGQLGAQVITTGTTVGADIGTSISDAAISEWDDIGERMKTIGDDAATDGGASFARRWMDSLQAGIDAGMVNVATAASIMQGVLETVMDPFAGGSIFSLAERSGPWGFMELMNARMKELLKNNTEMISDTFHGPKTESTLPVPPTGPIGHQGPDVTGGITDWAAYYAKKAAERAAKYAIPEPDLPVEPAITALDVMTEALGDGILSMGDVLKARAGGFDDVAHLMMRSIGGLANIQDVLKARTLGLDDLAEFLMREIAGIEDIPTTIELPFDPDEGLKWVPGDQSIDGPMDHDDGGMWTPSEEDHASFSGSQGTTENHYHINGYIQGEDDLLRVLSIASQRAGGQPIGPPR